MPTSDYAPTVTDVARKLRTRTREALGNLAVDTDGLPTFNDQTTPTATEVSGLIDDGLKEVSDSIGSDIPPSMFDAASRVVTLLVAANVELSYATDQAGQRSSTYDKLYKRYEDAMMTLQEDMSEEEESEQEAVDLSTGTGFPQATGWDRLAW